MKNAFFERTLTELDHARLLGMISRNHDASELAELLDAAEIVASADVPCTVATMRSQVLLTDTSSGRDFEVVLNYPDEADTREGRISVLSPIGLALLGCKVGDHPVWHRADGTQTHALFKALLFQPEAAGQFLR